VYAAGDLGDGAGENLAVVSLSEAGTLRWKLTTRSLGTAPVMSSLAVGADGGVYFAAQMMGPATFGDQTFQRDKDMYLVRFEADGRVRWALDFAAPFTWPWALAPLPGGRLGLLGQSRDQGSILGLPLRANGAAVPEALYLLSLKQP
jgi:hypothetical protein